MIREFCFDDFLYQASRNVDVLKDHEAVKQLGSILKVLILSIFLLFFKLKEQLSIKLTFTISPPQTNVRACKALGHPYVLQLGRYVLAEPVIEKKNLLRIRIF